MKLFNKKTNKRRFTRVKPDKKNPVTVNINGKNFLKILYAHNISEGGISVHVPEKFDGCEINKDVSLVISLPPPVKRSFIVSARIIHVEDEKFGVQFLNLKDEYRNNLKQYVSHRIQDKSILKKTLKFKYKLPKFKSNKKGDKRRFVRVNPLKKAPISIDINGVNFLKIIHASDISEGGIGIRVPEKFKGCEINKNVSLVISLPKPYNKSFLVTGRIIHVVNEKFGVEFLDLSKENRDILKKYINKRLKDDPTKKKEKKLLIYILLLNFFVASICITIIGRMIFPSNSKVDKKQISSIDKKQSKKIKKNTKKAKLKNKERKVSKDIESQQLLYDQDKDVITISNNSENQEPLEPTEDIETFNKYSYYLRNPENTDNELEGNTLENDIYKDELENNEIENTYMNNIERVNNEIENYETSDNEISNKNISDNTFENDENSEDLDDNNDLNEYDSVFISDIYGKKIKIRGEKWFYFYHNNTVSRKGSSNNTYLYASNYYIEENKIIMEISYSQKSILSFSSDNISTGDICSFEKYIDDEQVDINQSIVNQIFDAE